MTNGRTREDGGRGVGQNDALVSVGHVAVEARGIDSIDPAKMTTGGSTRLQLQWFTVTKTY